MKNLFGHHSDEELAKVLAYHKEQEKLHKKYRKLAEEEQKKRQSKS